MKIPGRELSKVTITCWAVLALNGAMPGRVPESWITRRVVLVQSELDYLRTAKSKFTLHLKEATIKQVFDGIARTTGVNIAYQGEINDSRKADINFTGVTLKHMLSELGQRYDLSYRVDSPMSLTVIGAQAK